ncbi:P27 family phage terminase small subunit [Novosphingobium album (ex Liu et al. 2023)]|uniref:P27 family phage terminase small subunit n=1 Tax=Novosphingobium album (ex Liu et al. 2023) TaxID=3031130 RepID=A0ABT5WY10_9SPHN|nr:P27 family phage terminase small subunit [Novosphingobium album (ex Liu et al. 2023)]MDE8654782.1 P27 family phage terminase small subunit [Novosphingobium album (ex Liu et al. 2023)]
MTAADGVPEPKWATLLKDRGERAAAKAHWKRVTDEMRERETLSPSNGHAVQRLVLAYIIYDRCSAQVADGGVISEPAKDNPKAIARLSVFYQAMREAENTAERLENQLGLTPQRRGKVSKVTKKRERSAGADAYLRPKG